MDDFRVRLTVEAMRHEIIHAFSAHSDEVIEAVEAETKRALESFDFRAHVGQFLFREIDSVIEQCVKQALRNPEVMQKLENLVVEGVRKVLDE